MHENDLDLLKAVTSKWADRSEKLAETNPKAKEAFDRIHNLYVKLLGMARRAFGESIDEVIDIITECRERIRAI